MPPKRSAPPLGWIGVIRLLAPLALLALGCKPTPKVALVGEWRVTVNADRGFYYDKLTFDASVAEDGTFELTGDHRFQAMAGQARVAGNYEFVDNHRVRVKMSPQGFDYSTTNYAITVVGRNELVFNAEDYSVTLTRR